MKTLAIALAMLTSSQAFAAGAVTYNCIGQDKITKDSVVFELTFADYARGAGYTNQSITIEKKGWEKLETPVVFQMYGATKRNNCKKNSQGEILLVNTLDMEPTQNGDIADYTISVKSVCPGAQLDVKAYCLFQ